MKKALVVLLALTCLGAAAFADMAAPTAGSFHAWNQGNLFPYYSIGSTAASMGWGPQVGRSAGYRPGVDVLV